MHYAVEEFTPEEEATLRPYFTNLDGPVFALVNLPEVVKGALFARYSRTPKSLRRLFLDEFAEPLESGAVAGLEGVKVDKAEQLFERVFLEFGDDSVAQLGGVHLACEQASQPLAKAIAMTVVDLWASAGLLDAARADFIAGPGNEVAAQ